MLNSAKQKMVDFYYRNGGAMGMWLLKNSVIAVICVVALIILTGVKITFMGILEWLIALPLLSVLVIIVRCAIILVHKIIPMRPGIVKFIFDFIVFGFVMMSIGFFMDKIPMPESNALQIAIMLVFDALYTALVTFLLMANKSRA